MGRSSRTFRTFGKVMRRAMPALNLLFCILFFGMCVFGALVYEFERGTWMYQEYTATAGYAYMRVGQDGETMEPSPYTSIPASFWWFIVTATTVGYGDLVPTSTFGKLISALTMLGSLLVIAFPVSVFTTLWDEEFNKKSNRRESDVRTEVSEFGSDVGFLADVEGENGLRKEVAKLQEGQRRIEAMLIKLSKDN